MFDLVLNQKRKHILHVDADAFFASVEQVLNPRLKGKPLIVGGSSDRNGIASAVSYEARKYGIYSGMPIYLARKKCPKAVIVPGNFEAYRHFSRRIYDVMREFTPDIEVASIDEAYLNITGCEKFYKKEAAEIAKDLLMKIYRNVGVSVSCGLASSKTVAKVASSTNKPHKLTVVPYGKEKNFLTPLSLRAIPGIGPRTFSLLESHGFDKIGDLNKLSLQEVTAKFGIQGIPLWKKANGIDNQEVVSTFSLPKSISKEMTFYKDLGNREECLRHLKDLSRIVFEKLRSYKLKARTVFVKLRYQDFDEGKKIFRDFSFQKPLDFPSSLDTKLFPVVKNLFLSHFVPDEPVRLVGMGVSHLINNYNLSLFENDDEEEKLFLEIDMIKKLYGEESIRYGV